MRRVDRLRDGEPSTPLSPLGAAARSGDVSAVRRLIAEGAAVEGAAGDHGAPLWQACASDAPDEAAIIEVLDRSLIRDPFFRAAVKAIHRGDVVGLVRLLDREPRLLHERILGPDCYRQADRPQYFRDPKLFWFIANNPTLVKRMPDNMVEVAEAMIARKVGKADLDYALELVMTRSPAREQSLQIPLLELLLKAGATPTTRAIDMTLAHRELAPIAAALGRTEALVELLDAASADEIRRSFGLAVINGRIDAARRALDAGADPNAFLPVHAHALALHTAVLEENLDMMDLLIGRGARTDIADKLWDSTPLGWAIHQGKVRARAYLENVPNRPA
jgi:hypothetical protein